MSNTNANTKSQKTHKKIKMVGGESGSGGGDIPDNIIDFVIQTSPDGGDDVGMIAGALNYGSNALDTAQNTLVTATNALATAKNVTDQAVDIGGKVVEKTIQLKDVSCLCPQNS